VHRNLIYILLVLHFYSDLTCNKHNIRNSIGGGGSQTLEMVFSNKYITNYNEIMFVFFSFLYLIYIFPWHLPLVFYKTLQLSSTLQFLITSNREQLSRLYTMTAENPDSTSVRNELTQYYINLPIASFIGRTFSLQTILPINPSPRFHLNFHLKPPYSNVICIEGKSEDWSMFVHTFRTPNPKLSVGICDLVQEPHAVENEIVVSPNFENNTCT